MSEQTETIEFRCTEEFKKQTRVQAAHNDESMAAYLRRLIKEDGDRPEYTEPVSADA